MGRHSKRLPTSAQVACYANSLSRAEIARAYARLRNRNQCSITFVQDVLAGNKNAPEPFRVLLSQLTGWPVEALFPEPETRMTSTVGMDGGVNRGH